MRERESEREREKKIKTKDKEKYGDEREQHKSDYIPSYVAQT